MHQRLTASLRRKKEKNHMAPSLNREKNFASFIKEKGKKI